MLLNNFLIGADIFMDKNSDSAAEVHAVLSRAMFPNCRNAKKKKITPNIKNIAKIYLLVTCCNCICHSYVIF